MTDNQVVQLGLEAMTLAAKLGAPVLLTALLIGFAVSLFQSVTQIQEQTLTFVPKICAMITAAVLLMPWIGHHLLEYATVMFRGMQ